MHQAITLDPTSWGYKWSADRPEDKVLVPIGERNAPEPFELHLLGNLEEELKVPEVMKGVVKIHQKLAYEEYYRTLSEMVRSKPSCLASYSQELTLNVVLVSPDRMLFSLHSLMVATPGTWPPLR